MRAFLIQGFFLQEHLLLGLKHLAESEGGVKAIIQQEVVAHMWSGVIFENPDGVLMGELLDEFGESVLTEIKLTEDKLSFTKKYYPRPDAIHYNLTKKDGYWIGDYSGELVGDGVVRCVLTEMAEDFFTFEESLEK